MVALEAEGAGPEFGAEVWGASIASVKKLELWDKEGGVENVNVNERKLTNLTKRIQHRSASLSSTPYRVVGEGGGGAGYFLKGGVEGGDRGDDAGGFEAGGGPVVPC